MGRTEGPFVKCLVIKPQKSVVGMWKYKNRECDTRGHEAWQIEGVGDSEECVCSVVGIRKQMPSGGDGAVRDFCMTSTDWHLLLIAPAHSL